MRAEEPAGVDCFPQPLTTNRRKGSSQPIQGATLFVAHLASLGKWYVIFFGGGLWEPKGPGSILIGDSAASIHYTGDPHIFL